MEIQRKTYRIIYDVTGIILRWNKQQLSDKEAMNEIVRTMTYEGAKNEEDDVFLENVQVNKESIDELWQQEKNLSKEINQIQKDFKNYKDFKDQEKQLKKELKKKKSSSILVQKKVIAPMVIGVVFFAVLFGVTEPFTTNQDIKIVEEEQISFEQLDETSSNIKEQNNSVEEELSNKTISKIDS